MVDAGWRGNLQVLLSKALRLSPTAQPPPKLLGLYFGLNQLPPSDAGETATFMAPTAKYNAHLIELFCSADHGSTLQYTAELPHYRLQSEANDAALRWGVQVQQRAARAFAERYCDVAQYAGLSLQEMAAGLRDAGNEGYRRLWQMPSADEASVYGAFEHAETATHSDPCELAPRITAKDLLRRARGHHAAAQSLWQPASLRRGLSAGWLSPLADVLLYTRSAVQNRRTS